MLKRTYHIWMDDSFIRFPATMLLGALRACFPGFKWIAEDITNDSNTEHGRFQVAAGEEANPELLKACCHYLDDVLAGLPDPHGSIQEARRFSGLWNNGIACRYDRINPQLLEWEQRKLIDTENQPA